MIRLSEYFSSYVLLWYFLYVLKFIPFNPIIIFYFILSFVIWMSFYMIYIGISTKKILFFIVFGIILIKILPILTLKNEIRSYDILFGLSIFLTYHVTLYYIKGVEPIQHYINFINYYNNLPNNIFKIICSITLI